MPAQIGSIDGHDDHVADSLPNLVFTPGTHVGLCGLERMDASDGDRQPQKRVDELLFHRVIFSLWPSIRCEPARRYPSDSMKRLAPAVVLSVVLLLAGCGRTTPAAEVATDDPIAVPTFAPETTMARIQASGRLIAGVKFDQPGFGRRQADGRVEGFDIEIVHLLAQGIFGGTKAEAEPRVELVEAAPRNREPFLQEGRVDVVVATYTINDVRKALVDFAGPYHVAHGDVMVRRETTNIRTASDLNGKSVCIVRGSTYERSLRQQAPLATLVSQDTYSQCAAELRRSAIEAVSSDNGVLGAYVEASDDAFRLARIDFTNEPYGIGLRKGDDAFRGFLNDRLAAAFANGQWRTAYERTLGDELGLTVTAPPALDRYVVTTTALPGASPSGEAATATTTAVPVPPATVPPGPTPQPVSPP